MSSLRSDRDQTTLEATEEKKKSAALPFDLSHSWDELAWYKASKEEHWEVQKKEFLKQLEFHELLGTWASFLFDSRFAGAVRQFKKVGYLPDGAPTNFLSPDVALAEITDSQLKD